MERLDIPYFYCFPDGKDLFSEGRMLAKDFFDKSVNEHIDMRVNLLKDDQEIERCIKLVLESLRRPTPSVTPLDKILFAQIMNKC
jgi:lantibiotic modifying enzyme